MKPQPLDVFRSPLDGANLIEASAGTGKTWAICALYLRLLLERRLEVQQILVVTFTKAATAELRERIRSRIAQTLARLRGAPGDSADPFADTLLQSLRERGAPADHDLALALDLALQTFDEASIFTIHGFCQRSLADAAFSAAMPLAPEQLTDDAELRLQAVNDFWRRHVAGEVLPPALAALLLDKNDRPERWAALLGRALAKPLARVVWPPLAEGETGVDTNALVAAHQAAQATWHAERERIVAIVSEALPRLNGVAYKPSSLAIAAASWDALLALDDPLAAPAKLDKLDLLTTARLQPRNGQPPVLPHPFFAQAEDLLGRREAAQRALAAQRLRLLRRMLDETPARLRATKRERRVVAFDDMLYNLYERLTSGAQPQLAAALKARFPAALIDEFQDTDPLQLAIFRSIYGAGDSPLFLVGDPKQAIYSFRNADLHTYLRARRDAAACYTLADNQRSSRELLQGLNALFSANPRAFVLPGLDHAPVGFGAKPRKAWADTTLPRAPLQLWALPGGPDGEPLPKHDARRAAVDACAGEIARLLGAGQRGEIAYDGRALSGGDIAVLVRSHADGSEMRRALALLGVASVELSQASIFQSPDAEDLERVLMAIAEPAREALLRAALATSIIGFDAEAIDAISADEPRLLAVVTRFAAYQGQWLRRGIGVMLRALMAGEGVPQRLLARPDGERRMTNLLHLGECLHQAAQTHASPPQLLRWLQSRRRDDRTDDAAQLRLESDRHLVQIVTIHRAKGLEYPVVFCPLLWDGHPGGRNAAIDGREYHDDAGEPVIDFRDRADDAALKSRIAIERAAESLRLVYVALTRAVQRCTLVVGSYQRRHGLGRSSAESGRSMINWLVADAGRSPEQWLADKTLPAQITAAWERFAAANPGGVALAPLPAGPWAAVDPRHIAPEALAALAPPQRIPGAWWIGSYSSLAYGARHDAAAVDHDARAAEAAATGEGAAAAAPVDDDVLDFPRGAEAGNCIHKVFELADFTDRATWGHAIAAALGEPAGSGEREAERHSCMLRRMLADVLHAPLPHGLVLAQVLPSRRLTELEFNLPAAHLRADALAALLQAHGHPVPALGFDVLEGYLRGFIDLVVEHRGRFFLIDWKSNHLGRTSADYGAASLARAIHAHGYQLQYLLYAVALHRYLRDRISDYRFDDHFGGAIYLFVRGIRPGWAGADGVPAGVYRDRPSRQLVERLSALLDAGREQA